MHSTVKLIAPLANLTGHPAITFPAGYAEGNVPVAIQLIGKAWSEMDLLSAAHTFENHVKTGEAPKTLGFIGIGIWLPLLRTRAPDNPSLSRVV